MKIRYSKLNNRVRIFSCPLLFFTKNDNIYKMEIRHLKRYTFFSSNLLMSILLIFIMNNSYYKQWRFKTINQIYLIEFKSLRICIQFSI